MRENRKYPSILAPAVSFVSCTATKSCSMVVMDIYTENGAAIMEK